MNIKEVEKEVGIRKANIRYYEEQGLITPNRNSENNYRNYTREDIDCLEKIKGLRLLGITVAEIKALQEGSISLDAAMSKRIFEIEQEIAELGEVKEICQLLKEHNQSYETLDISLMVMRNSLSLKKGVTFMKLDKRKNYEEAFQRAKDILGYFVLLIVVPTNFLNLFSYSLPKWMTWLSAGGVGVIGTIAIIMFLLMSV